MIPRHADLRTVPTNTLSAWQENQSGEHKGSYDPDPVGREARIHLLELQVARLLDLQDRPRRHTVNKYTRPCYIVETGQAFETLYAAEAFAQAAADRIYQALNKGHRCAGYRWRWA